MAATNELGRLKLTFRGFQKSSHRPVDMNEFLDEHLMTIQWLLRDLVSLIINAKMSKYLNGKNAKINRIG